jgi:hypothetical protein
MQTHLRAAVPSHRAPPAPSLKPPEPGAGLIETIGAIEDEDRILVIGQDGPELMCTLIRAGATQVTHLRSHERPEAESASLAIVPQVPSLDWLAGALPSIRRALLPNGRLVVAVATQPAATQAVASRAVAARAVATQAVASRAVATQAVASQAVSSHSVRRLLASHGFTAIRTRQAAGRQVFSAELPTFGLLRCA